MRTTVDLSPAVHRRAVALAKARGVSLSATVAELATRGLAQLDEPIAIETDPATGFPFVRLGRTVTDDDVAAALQDE